MSADAVKAAKRAWQRLPSKERADLLQYMRDEADDFESPMASPFPGSEGRVKARVNRAAVALLVAIAGEPKPVPAERHRWGR